MKALKLIALSITLLPFFVEACGSIAGMWKHADKPAWLEVKFNAENIGALVVKRHDNNEKASGLTVIKNISRQIDNPAQWRGKMYSAAVNDYVDVHLNLTDSKTIKVFEASDAQRASEILRLLRQ